MMRNLTLAVLAALFTAVLSGCVPLAAATVATGALVATDRRTAGIYLEDENIEWKVLGRMRAERFASAHVNAASYNRRVLLMGEAPTEALRSAIEADVRTIPNVRDVTDEIQVAGASSLTSRGNDALITSNVKARMVNNGKFSTNHVKVVTEAGVVYLMGIVTRDEGEAAAEIARSTSGVARVVKVFEYT
jgi:osmotically-inducible protein OsmY